MRRRYECGVLPVEEGQIRGVFRVMAFTNDASPPKLCAEHRPIWKESVRVFIVHHKRRS